MNLSIIEYNFLKAASNEKYIYKKNGLFHAGNQTIKCQHIGKLIRAGYFRGKRGSLVLNISNQTRKLFSIQQFPPINTSISFVDLSCHSWESNNDKRSKYGRVIYIIEAKEPYILFPKMIVSSNNYIYEVSRPHSAAPWKGIKRSCGYYRETSLWDIIVKNNLVPKEYFEPFKSKEKTLARLREVKERCDLIGNYPHIGIEEKCCFILTSLSFFRTHISESSEEGKYLKEVYENDKDEIDKLAYEFIKNQINDIQRHNAHPFGSIDKMVEVDVLSFEEIKKDLYSFQLPLYLDFIEKAYYETLPKWKESIKKRNEIINKYRKIN